MATPVQLGRKAGRIEILKKRRFPHSWFRRSGTFPDEALTTRFGLFYPSLLQIYKQYLE